MHGARRPGRRDGHHDDRGPGEKRRAPSGPAGLPRPPRAPVRLLHAGNGARGGQPHRQRRRDRRGRRFAKGSRGTSAAAPGTTTSSRPSRQLRGWRHDRDGDPTQGDRNVRQAQGRRIAPTRGRNLHRQPDAARHRLHGRCSQPVSACTDQRREPRCRACGRGCRSGLLGRGPRGRVEGRVAVRMACHRGHQDADALPPRDRRGPLPGRGRRRRCRREPCAREGCGRARRGRLRAASVDRERREGARKRRAARPLRVRVERVLRLEAGDGRRAVRDRRGRRRRNPALRPTSADTECDGAARSARAGRPDWRRHLVVGDPDAAHPALRTAARARDPRVEATGDRS